MGDSQGRKKDKNQHIQVFARIRPPNQAEICGKSSTVVEVASPRECIVRERPQDKLTKKFTFDRVFGPSSKQLEVYNAVVSPLLEEVLAGYNCTVFAYGQTGTGKTFTMEGMSNDPAIHWQSDTTAGIIPRSLSHLFDELRMLESQEYSVRVSFLELYNEELFDLLSPNDDASKIRLYEDATKKGAVIIHGLEEVTVHNKNEVYKILEKGSEKRQTAATLMNAHSSRSHTVFSLTVHIKENTVDGEELLKTGKLNLVDLAGSENVGRSGAVDRRAREAGNINQSLLTLGRVITALVERAPHIPYRESKLTRLLQESLGGRTKTSIIATVSPASINLEETLSTLDYAHRAKNITNRPEINQKLSKKALLKEYTEEIERLRRDLLATRERNGVYLAHENYNAMQTTIEFQEKEIEEKLNHIKALEETMAAKEKLLMELRMDLVVTKRQVEITKQERNEQKYLVERHVKTETQLLEQAKTLLDVADIATVDTFKLHEKIARKCDIEMENETIGEKFKENIAKKFGEVENDLVNYARELADFYLSSKNEIGKQMIDNNSFFDNSIQCMSRNLMKNQESVVDDLTKNVNVSYDNYEVWFEDIINNATSMTDLEREALKKISVDFAPKISQLMENKIGKNLQIIREETTKNLINLRENTKNTFGILINKIVNERNLLKRELELLSNNFEIVKKIAEQSVVEDKEFTDLNENYCRELNKWHDKQKQRRIATIESSKSALNTCKNVDIQVEKISTNQREIETFIHENLCTNVTEITEKLSDELEQNYKLSENLIEKTAIIQTELEKELEKNCENLSTHKNEMKSHKNKYKQQTELDRKKTLALIDSDWKMIAEMCRCHEETTENHRKQVENDFTEFNNKFVTQESYTMEWNEKMSKRLNETREKIEQFWGADLKRDKPTGTTPAKREFLYPRQLVKTSPHSRILQHYRQQRTNETSVTNESEFDSSSMSVDSTLLNSPSNDTIVSNEMQFSTPITANNTINHVLPTSEPINKSLHDNSSNTSITKSASVSDITAVTTNNMTITTATNQSIAKSESELFNKENGDIGGRNGSDFVKPSLKQPKYGIKSRMGNSTGKRILASRNE